MMDMNVNTIRKASPAAAAAAAAAAAQPTMLHQDAKSLKEICVIDPTSRYGKLTIPMAYTFDTKGRAEWIKCGGRLKKDLSICCLFQKGKCHVGERCFQVHIDRSYVTDLRKKYANLTTCCHGCGDVHSDTDAHRRMLQTSFPRGVVGITFGGSEDVVELPAARLASTIGLEDALRFQRDGVARRRDGTPVFAFNKLCRLHLKNACKYGRDCKNLHVCYKCAGELGQEPTADGSAVFEERREYRPPRQMPLSSVSSAADSIHHHTAAGDSLCPTPELRSRTSTPSLGSPVDASVPHYVAPLSALTPLSRAKENQDDAVDYVNGIAVSPTKLSFAHIVQQQQQQQQQPDASSDMTFLSRFQSHWPQANKAASTESLQIIFGGFPSISL